ncbi:hypothetical protein ACWDR0_15880 [Streptomyces sp. NPDC003691]
MRTIHTALAAAAGLALALGTGLSTAQAAPAAAAQAQGPGCNSAYSTHQGDGNVRAYYLDDCNTLLGAASGNDSNWSDASGAFQGSDNDNARSVLNTGTYSGGVNDVQFYLHSGYTGGTGCLDWNELYVDGLSRNTFNDAARTNAADSISSHRWVNGCTNAWQ